MLQLNRLMKSLAGNQFAGSEPCTAAGHIVSHPPSYVLLSCRSPWAYGVWWLWDKCPGTGSACLCLIYFGNVQIQIGS